MRYLAIETDCSEEYCKKCQFKVDSMVDNNGYACDIYEVELEHDGKGTLRDSECKLDEIRGSFYRERYFNHGQR